MSETHEEAPFWTDPRWNQERGSFRIRETDRLYIDIMPLLFTKAIVITLKGSSPFYDMFYADRWCYHSFEDAERAIQGWEDPDAWPESEPQGWHRHPRTGRRRPDGDPSKEYVNP
jgi:hypothetical protein